MPVMVPGSLGGPGLPGRVRIAEGTLATRGIVESDEFNRFIKKAERAGDELMNRLAENMERRAKRYVPKRTMKLHNSIKGLVYEQGSVRVAILYSNVPYARLMEEGTRPHLIHGVRANFNWREGYFEWDDPRFRVRKNRGGYQNWTPEHGATVRHPGTRPYRFFQRAFDETYREARIIMREVYGRR